jgi:4-hydroxy-3-polyprenylbenzoate decarboxylase
MAIKNIIVAMTGASGPIFGIRTLEILKQLEIKSHLIISSASRITISEETEWEVEDVLELADVYYQEDEIEAPIASGSTITNGMIIVPCTIKTLSAIANSYTNNLITRSADVCLKEGRPLILALRETPLHRGHIRLMDLAARAGAIIFPLIPSFFGQPVTLEDAINNLVGRMLLRMGIDNIHFTKWE